MSSGQRDFTQGSIARGMIAFSMPFLLSNVLQALYGAVDMWVVGNYSSADEAARTAILSGVNIGSQITNLVAMMVSGLTVSGTVMVGQYVGAKRHKDASETVGTMFTMLGIAGVALMAVMMLLSGPMLRLLDTPPEAFEHAKTYLNICLAGTLFIFGYNAVSSIQRGLGDSIRPLIFVGVACVVNVVLDLWLVKGLGMGAAGAALATVIAQAVSLIMAGWYLGKNRFIFDFKPRSFRIQKEKMKLMIKLGIPSSVQSIIVNVSFLVMTALRVYRLRRRGGGGQIQFLCHPAGGGHVLLRQRLRRPEYRSAEIRPGEKEPGGGHCDRPVHFGGGVFAGAIVPPGDHRLL